MIKNGYMLIPLFVIIGTIMSGFTPQRAALFGILSAFLVCLVRKESRMNLRKLSMYLEQGSKGCAYRLLRRLRLREL